jgi:hypothetical protein
LFEHHVGRGELTPHAERGLVAYIRREATAVFDQVDLMACAGHGLLRGTDASLTLLDHRIAALWRAARERAEEARASRLRRFRELLGDLAGLAGDEALDAAELRSRLHGLIARRRSDTSQVSAIRQELGRKSHDLARLLKTERAAALAVPADHQLTAAFALDAVAASSAATLPNGDSQPFGLSWQGLIEQSDRAAALGCFRAATLMALKRAPPTGHPRTS